MQVASGLSVITCSAARPGIYTEANKQKKNDTFGLDKKGRLTVTSERFGGSLYQQTRRTDRNSLGGHRMALIKKKLSGKYVHKYRRKHVSPEFAKIVANASQESKV